MGRIVAVVEPGAQTVLPPFRDDELHPSIAEAVKRLAIETQEHTHSIQTIEAQYLRPLTGLGPDVLKQANAVRVLAGLPDANLL